MWVLGVIPARFASSRLPGKPLVDIDRLPMVVHTLKRAMMSTTLDELVVACDDERIVEAVEQNGGKALLTSMDHQTGTDRVAEVAGHYPAATHIVDIQGDEPLLRPQHVDISVSTAVSQSYQVTCPCARFAKPTDALAASAIKVVRNLKGEVMYYSRETIPSAARSEQREYYRQVCIYTFTREFLLQKFAGWEQTPLENTEFVELLRVLEHGYPIAAPIVEDYKFSVDTPVELQDARKLMPEDPFRGLY
jgi:3-deoxy-manno-octulosonate cytidylyltransferase (CMP-KDO synthetase)